MTSELTYSQTYFIPDTNMRGWLNSLALGCVDINGMLDPNNSDLVQVESASIYVHWSDLTGIQYLDNLKELHMNHSNANVYLPAFPDSLKQLRITTLPTTYTTLPPLPPTLNSLILNVAYDFQGFQFPFPETLDSLTILSVSPFTTLADLPNKMTYLKVQSTTLNEILVLPDSLNELIIMTPILNCLPLIPNGLQSLSGYSDSLTCLPNLPSGMNISGSLPTSMCTILSDCPYGNGRILGKMWLDLNGNGIKDPGEPRDPGGYVSITPGNWMLGLDLNGNWTTNADTGSYAISPVPQHPYTQSTTPTTHSAQLTISDPIDSLNDFGVVLTPNITDVSVDLHVTWAIPGNTTLATITLVNLGSLPASGNLQFDFGNLQNFVSAYPTQSSLSGGIVDWGFVNIPVGAVLQYNVVLYNPTNLTLGTPLLYTAIASTTATDPTLINNKANVDDVIITSYDPNDKLVLPEILTPLMIQEGEPLTYTIRFQNTGTAPANRVVITDTLESGINLSSFEWISSSHFSTWYIQDRTLHFIFDNIALPDSTTDELGSQGFVRFRMEAEPTLQVGDSVQNKANIYFDYNDPVITAPATFTVELIDAISDLTSKSKISLFPNPAREALRIVLSDKNLNGMQITVFDATGREIQQNTLSRSGILDISSLNKGTYMLLLIGNNARYFQLFVKQ